MQCPNCTPCPCPFYPPHTDDVRHMMCHMSPPPNTIHTHLPWVVKHPELAEQLHTGGVLAGGKREGQHLQRTQENNSSTGCCSSAVT